MFNARSETVDEKFVFRRLLASQRCVVLFNGFYEWKQEGSKKQPYYIHLGEGKVIRLVNRPGMTDFSSIFPISPFASP